MGSGNVDGLVWADGACVTLSYFSPFLFFSFFFLRSAMFVTSSGRNPKTILLRCCSSSGTYYGFVHVALTSRGIAHAWVYQKLYILLHT
jgi:hypothetical protein